MKWIMAIFPRYLHTLRSSPVSVEADIAGLSSLSRVLFGIVGQELRPIADTARSIEPSAGSLKNPMVDWYQYTTPQAGLGGRAPLYTSGKTFGGGSARNFLQYQRYVLGSPHTHSSRVFLAG